jgi:hypothetical protein
VNLNVSINATELKAFGEAFRARVARSTKSLHHNTNRTAFRIAKRSIELTPIASKPKIEALGISAYRVFSKSRTLKSGVVKPGKRLKRPKAVFSYGGRARDIWVGGYVNSHGDLPPELKNATSAKQAEAKIRAVINSRLRRRGFLKSGFVPAYVNFAKAVKDGASGTPFESVRLLKKENGSYKIAQPGLSPEAQIIHNAIMDGAYSGKPYAQLVAAVRQAMVEETAEMVAYQQKQLAENFK